jgi:hypothetical protein
MDEISLDSQPPPHWIRLLFDEVDKSLKLPWPIAQVTLIRDGSNNIPLFECIDFMNLTLERFFLTYSFKLYTFPLSGQFDIIVIQVKL